MIYILGGHHCDKKLCKKIITFFEKVKPDLVCIEELTHDTQVISACNDLREKKIGIDTFKSITKFEEYWFEFSPYRELFLYLQKCKIRFYPIDHPLKERIKLIKLEKKVLTEWEKGRDVTLLKEKVRQNVVFDREKEMVKNTHRGVRKYESKTTCVIVGDSHTNRVGNALREQGYRINKKHISNTGEMERYYNKILRYAKRHKTINLTVPPLVPIFVEVAKKVN